MAIVGVQVKQEFLMKTENIECPNRNEIQTDLQEQKQCEFEQKFENVFKCEPEDDLVLLKTEKSDEGDRKIKDSKFASTSYKCQLCETTFIEYSEYKMHKKQHFVEKRRCKVCNIVCQSVGKLQEHTYNHLGVKPFNCDVCGKAFVSIHHVKLHKRSHNTEKVFKCSKCDKAFKNRGSLRSHHLVHAEKMKEFKCNVCNRQCIDLPDFRKHMETHGKKTEIKCGLCDKVFNSDRGLECHISVHKELQFPCEYCGKIYPSMYRIKRHIKRTHIPNECEDCNQIFYDRAAYTKHRKEHNEKKPAECEYCKKVFDKLKNLTEHIRLQHKQDKEKKVCHICSKEFINSSLLRNHVKTHDKCFKCSDCDKVFSSRYNLLTHSVTHSGAKNHRCPICEKCYSTKTSLKNHVAIHSEERSFQCEICKKTFKTNRRLYVHKMSHNTEEKYQCTICLQKFKVKQYLNCHMIKHSKVKPFQCNVCEKRFKHKKSYEKHMNIGKHKSRNIEHDCDICDESFSTKDKLIEHFGQVHSEEPNNEDDGQEEPMKMEIFYDEGKINDK